MDGYEATYEKPMMLYLRSVLDSYLAGAIEGVDYPELVTVAGELSPGVPQGLDSFDPIYFEEPLLILSVDPAMMGGYEVRLISANPDLQDKVFVAWIYDRSETDFDLEGFWLDTEFDADKIREVLDYYAPVLEASDKTL